MQPLLRSLASCFVLALAAPAALADVLVVAPAGAPFSTISTAVAAAQSGDVILVKSGAYGGFTISAKGLSVIADADASVTIVGEIGMDHVPAGATVLLRRLAMPVGQPNESALRVSSCDGAVRVEECSFQGYGDDPFGGASSTSVSIGHSSQVAFAHCSFIGGAGTSSSIGTQYSDGMPALTCGTSNVALWQCSLTGGKGGLGHSLGPAPKGGAGVLLWSGTLSLDGCTVVGGEGGTGYGSVFAVGPGGPGGTGLRVDDGLVRRTASSVVGGTGGPGGVSPFGGPAGPAGPAGDDLSVPPGAVADYPGAARDLSVNSPVRTGETAILQFGVVPCDSVFLLASADTQFHWLAGPKSTLIPAPPFAMLGLALPCASGTLPFAAPVGPLPAGLDNLTVHLQGLHVNDSEGKRLGPYTVLTLLDASIP